MWTELKPYDYIIANAPIIHPETLQEIVHEGQWLNIDILETLHKEFGIDEVTGHIVRWPT